MHDFCSVVKKIAAEFGPGDRGLANIFMLASQGGNQSKIRCTLYLVVKIGSYHEADSPPEANKDKWYITPRLPEAAICEGFPTFSSYFGCDTFLARGSDGRIT